MRALSYIPTPRRLLLERFGSRRGADLAVQRCHDEVDEPPHLRWYVVPRYIIHVEGESLVGPVGEKIDQRPSAQVLFKSEIYDLSDPEPSEADAELRAGICDRQPPIHSDGHHLVPSPELPFEGTAGGGVDGVDALVALACEIVRVPRLAVTGDVGW